MSISLGDIVCLDPLTDNPPPLSAKFGIMSSDLWRGRYRESWSLVCFLFNGGVVRENVIFRLLYQGTVFRLGFHSGQRFLVVERPTDYKTQIAQFLPCFRACLEEGRERIKKQRFEDDLAQALRVLKLGETNPNVDASLALAWKRHLDFLKALPQYSEPALRLEQQILDCLTKKEREKKQKEAVERQAQIGREIAFFCSTHSRGELIREVASHEGWKDVAILSPAERLELECIEEKRTRTPKGRVWKQKQYQHWLRLSLIPNLGHTQVDGKKCFLADPDHLPDAAQIAQWEQTRPVPTGGDFTGVTAIIKDRNWKPSEVERLLGEPDRLGVNPHYRSGPPTRLYLISRVEAAEASGQVSFRKSRATPSRSPLFHAITSERRGRRQRREAWEGFRAQKEEPGEWIDDDNRKGRAKRPKSSRTQQKWTPADQELCSRYVFQGFEALFPLARQAGRRVTIFAGPTNSGKTYSGFQLLQQAHAAGGKIAYFAPLRLLALEGQERLLAAGVPCDLITGEERSCQTPVPRAVASTIEMLNPQESYAAVLVDEGQLFADFDRGWAFTNALVGAQTSHLLITCSPDAVPALQSLFAYLKEPVDVISLQRKNGLLFCGKLSRKTLKENTAFIVFSRQEALLWKEQIELETGKLTAVLYGSLSPEARREQAQLFRTGSAPYLVATDAIAFGLNLPIDHIVFTTDEKFDGRGVVTLDQDLILQIAGRAGRFQPDQERQAPGRIWTTGVTDPDLIESALTVSLDSFSPEFSIKPRGEQLEDLARVLGTKDFLQSLMAWEHLEIKSSLFKKASLESIRAAYGRFQASQSSLSIPEIFRFCCAPWPNEILHPDKETYLLSGEWALRARRAIERAQPFPWKDQSYDGLFLAEGVAKLASLYQWLSWQWPQIFDQPAQARENAQRANADITRWLTKKAHASALQATKDSAA